MSQVLLTKQEQKSLVESSLFKQKPSARRSDKVVHLSLGGLLATQLRLVLISRKRCASPHGKPRLLSHENYPCQCHAKPALPDSRPEAGHAASLSTWTSLRL